MKNKIETNRGRNRNPLYFFIIAVVLIFTAEALDMLFLHSFLKHGSLLLEILIDSSILSIITIPMLYLLLVRPMLLYIKERDIAEQALQEAHEVLEARVEERTRELSLEVTERKQAERALKKSELNLTKAQEVAHIGSWHLDLLNNELFWTDENYRIFGIPMGTPMTYEKFLEVVHPEDRQYVDKKWSAAIGGEPYDIEHRLLIDNKVKWVREQAELTFDNEGNPTGGVGITNDINELKFAERALNAERTRLYSILDLFPGFVCLQAQDYTIRFANRRFIEEYGDPMGRACYKHIRGCDDPCEQCPTSIVFDTKKSHVWISDYSSRDRVYQVYGEPFIDSDGSMLVLEFSIDITAQKIAEQELLKAQKLESLGVLAGGIAHDFNNLLTGIIGNTSLLVHKVEKDGVISKRLGEVEKAAMHAQELTQQLLTFAKGGEPVKEASQLEEIIEESCKFCLYGSNVKFDITVAEDLLPVEVDRGQINQVMNNIIINAKQAMPDGGVIEVSISNCTVSADDDTALKTGKYVSVLINDHGVGIDKENLQKVFDPYFTTKKSGSGLGLASAYSVIQKHEGHIEVTSEPGVGTTFKMFMPVSEKGAVIRKEAHPELQRRAGGRVLVMDDEEIIRDVTTEILTTIGYDVVSTTDGKQAVAVYKEAKEGGKPFDAVIMDLTIPGGMGGKEVIKILQEYDPEVKAIVSSGYSSDTVMAEYGKFGFSGVITKPYKASELAAKVQDVIAAEL